MLLFFEITIPVLLALALISWVLYLFYAKVLHKRNDLLARIIVALLAVQFMLGMGANLFQTIPTKASYDVFHYPGYIFFHAINALFLVILSIIYAANTQEYKKIGIIGAVAMIIAYVNGMIFVLAGQNDIFSFIMALGFIVVFFCYTFIAVRSSSLQK